LEARVGPNTQELFKKGPSMEGVGILCNKEDDDKNKPIGLCKIWKLSTNQVSMRTGKEAEQEMHTPKVREA
jgi:hypothetical protein